MAVVGKIWAPWNQSSPKCPYSLIIIPLFPRSISPHFTLSNLVHRSREFNVISKGTIWNRMRIQRAVNMKRTYPKLQSIKQQLKPVKPNLSPYLTLRIRPTEAAFHLSLSSAQCSIFCYISHRITRPTGRGQNFTRGTPSNIRAKESVVCQ